MDIITNTTQIINPKKKEEKKRLKEVLQMPEEERVKALSDEFGFEIVEVEE